MTERITKPTTPGERAMWRKDSDFLLADEITLRLLDDIKERDRLLEMVATSIYAEQGTIASYHVLYDRLRNRIRALLAFRDSAEGDSNG